MCVCDANFLFPPPLLRVVLPVFFFIPLFAADSDFLAFTHRKMAQAQQPTFSVWRYRPFNSPGTIAMRTRLYSLNRSVVQASAVTDQPRNASGIRTDSRIPSVRLHPTTSLG